LPWAQVSGLQQQVVVVLGILRESFSSGTAPEPPLSVTQFLDGVQDGRDPSVARLVIREQIDVHPGTAARVELDAVHQGLRITVYDLGAFGRPGGQDRKSTRL